MELFIYIVIAIIWGIVSLIQKAAKENKKTKPKINKNYKPNTKKSNRNEEEIFRELQKNIKDLKNFNEDVLRENTKKEDVYSSNYETSNNRDVYTSNYEMSNKDIEILELQEKYNSKMAQINNIKEETVVNAAPAHHNKHVNNMLSSLDIKNAIIYNAILEPKRINYTRIKRS